MNKCTETNNELFNKNSQLFMSKYNIKDMNTDEGEKISYNESKTKKPINKDFIQKTKNALIKKSASLKKGILQTSLS